MSKKSTKKNLKLTANNSIEKLAPILKQSPQQDPINKFSGPQSKALNSWIQGINIQQLQFVRQTLDIAPQHFNLSKVQQALCSEQGDENSIVNALQPIRRARKLLEQCSQLLSSQGSLEAKQLRGLRGALKRHCILARNKLVALTEVGQILKRDGVFVIAMAKLLAEGDKTIQCQLVTRLSKGIDLNSDISKEYVNEARQILHLQAIPMHQEPMKQPVVALPKEPEREQAILIKDMEKSDSRRSVGKGSRADSIGFEDFQKQESISVKKSRKKSKKKRTAKIQTPRIEQPVQNSDSENVYQPKIITQKQQQEEPVSGSGEQEEEQEESEKKARMKGKKWDFEQEMELMMNYIQNGEDYPLIKQRMQSIRTSKALKARMHQIIVEAVAQYPQLESERQSVLKYIQQVVNNYRYNHGHGLDDITLY